MRVLAADEYFGYWGWWGRMLEGNTSIMSIIQISFLPSIFSDTEAGIIFQLMYQISSIILMEYQIGYYIGIIMINHLARLVKSAQRYPELLPFLNKLSSTHGLIVNHPVEFGRHPTKGFSLKSLSPIKPNFNIINISVNKCLTSHYMIGTTLAQNNKLSGSLDSFQTLDPQRDRDVIKTCKIVLQLFVSMNTPTFQLHEYAKYLSLYDSPSYHHLTTQDIQSIQSQRLLSLILNSQSKLDSIALEFNRKFPFVSSEQFLKMYTLTRSRVLSINDEMVLAPIIDMVNHSFEPNCEVTGKYVANNSFVILKSAKAIEPEEELSISYGEISNNELFFKYNFVVSPNPYSYMVVRLNYEEAEDYADILFEEKKGLLDKLGGIPETIRVLRTHIDIKSMSALRLYFMDESDLKSIGRLNEKVLESKISNGNEIRVIQFLISNLHTAYRFMHHGEYSNKSIETIQMEEIIIIKDLLDHLESQLKELQ